MGASRWNRQFQVRKLRHARNPKRDAAAIADALGKSGFQNVKTDLNRPNCLRLRSNPLPRTVRTPTGPLSIADTGIELDGSNYLVPVDAKFENDADNSRKRCSARPDSNAVGAADKMRLVILDACRENPFAADKKSLSVGRGLARIEPESGTLVALCNQTRSLRNRRIGG